MRSSEYSQCRRLDPRPQKLMQAVARHDIGLAAENAGGLPFYVHQLKQAELASLVVEKHVDLRALACFAAGRRVDRIKALYPQPPQLRVVPPQFGDRLIAPHRRPVGSKAM